MRFDDGWNNSWHRVGNIPGLIFSTSVQATKAHTREQRIPLIHIWQHGNFIRGIFRYSESGLSAGDWPSVTKQCGMSIYLKTSLKTGSVLLCACISSTQAFSLVVVQRLWGARYIHNKKTAQLISTFFPSILFHLSSSGLGGIVIGQCNAQLHSERPLLPVRWQYYVLCCPTKFPKTLEQRSKKL